MLLKLPTCAAHATATIARMNNLMLAIVRDKDFSEYAGSSHRVL